MKLNEESSFLTTFNTPFGHFQWQQLPVGISSAPEVVAQRKMHELIEGLTGIEVIADNFIIVGYGDKFKVNCSHDNTLMAFLESCREWNVKLNIEKLTLHEKEVPFIGLKATDRRLHIDPAKVRAITDMPVPTDKVGVQQ